MITTRFALPISLLVVCAAVSFAAQPISVEFEPPTQIDIEPQLANAAPRFKSSPWHPSFADIDGDKKTDLIIGVADRGSNKCGRALVLLNRGSQHQPEFDNAYWLDDAVLTARIPGG